MQISDLTKHYTRRHVSSCAHIQGIPSYWKYVLACMSVMHYNSMAAHTAAFRIIQWNQHLLNSFNESLLCGLFPCMWMFHWQQADLILVFLLFCVGGIQEVVNCTEVLTCWSYFVNTNLLSFWQYSEKDCWHKLDYLGQWHSLYVIFALFNLRIILYSGRVFSYRYRPGKYGL